MDGEPARGTLAAADPMGVADEITLVIDAADHLDVRWEAIRAHASQASPYDG